MSESKDPHVVRSRVWREEAEPDNAFAARAAYCRGYDVYGDMLGRARWVEMLWLLFQDEPPASAQADLLEALALALANPGPRDASVHAAMCAGVCGSPAASALMAALAVGAGGLSGGREILLAMQGWEACGTDLAAWQRWLPQPPSLAGSVWPDTGHAPGFDPHGVSTARPILQTLDCLVSYHSGGALSWLQANLPALEVAAGCPLALSGVAAAAFTDLGFTAEQGEFLHLLLRLPGAAAHALEQRPLGYKKFPFGSVELQTTAGKEPA
jgi:citrate synthase